MNAFVKYTFLILMISMLGYITVSGQQIRTLEKIMSDVKGGKMVNADTMIKSMKPGEGKRLLGELKRYHKDASPDIRLTSYSLAYKIALSNQGEDVKQIAVNSMAGSLADNDPLIWQYSAKRLMNFRKADYPAEAKSNIAKLLSDEKVNHDFILLAGVADLQGQTARLRQIIQQNQLADSASTTGKWYGKKSWAARLALARMGNQSEVQYCIAKIEAEPDEVIRVTSLLKDVGYIRQPEAIKVLQKYLESEARLPSIVANMPGTKYCEYALDILAQIIKGFPVPSRGIGYFDEEIDKARQWMRSNGSVAEIIR